MEDAIVKTNDFPVRLPVFEGPLDLLLYLVRRHELDIHDIPIETVTRQYLDILRGMEKMDLELAGEFFVMAATLMQIKSRMLLPRNDMPVGTSASDEPEEALDPRWELVQQLLEYKKFKEAAGALEDLISETQDRLPRVVGDKNEVHEPEAAKPTDRIELWNTFNTILRRLSERLTVGTIRSDSVTVADRMELILKYLETKDSFNFSDLFVGEEDVPLTTFVATFLAILELTRLKRLHVEQTEDFGDVRCRARTDGEALFQQGLVSEFDGPVADEEDPSEPSLFDRPVAEDPALSESDDANVEDDDLEDEEEWEEDDSDSRASAEPVGDPETSAEKDPAEGDDFESDEDEDEWEDDDDLDDIPDPDEEAKPGPG